MRAIQVIEECGPASVVLADVEEPDGDLVVQVRAAGVSFPDLLMTHGKYQVRQKLPFILGWEAAGDVIKAPPGGEFSVGDRVMTLTFGAHAERVAAVAETTFRLPDGLDYIRGAALPLNYLTALAAVQRRGALQPGETVLVHGAAGGVGSACIQIAKALGGRVIGCVSTDEKARVATTLGADTVLVGGEAHDNDSALRSQGPQAVPKAFLATDRVGQPAADAQRRCTGLLVRRARRRPRGPGGGPGSAGGSDHPRGDQSPDRRRLFPRRRRPGPAGSRRAPLHRQSDRRNGLSRATLRRLNPKLSQNCTCESIASTDQLELPSCRRNLLAVGTQDGQSPTLFAAPVPRS